MQQLAHAPLLESLATWPPATPPLPAVPHTSPLKSKGGSEHPNGQDKAADEVKVAGATPPELVEAVIRKGERQRLKWPATGMD